MSRPAQPSLQEAARVAQQIFEADVEAWIARELGEDEGELRW